MRTLLFFLRPGNIRGALRLRRQAKDLVHTAEIFMSHVASPHGVASRAEVEYLERVLAR